MQALKDTFINFTYPNLNHKFAEKIIKEKLAVLVLTLILVSMPVVMVVVIHLGFSPCPAISQ